MVKERLKILPAVLLLLGLLVIGHSYLSGADRLQKELADRQELLDLNRMLLNEIVELRRENEELRARWQEWLEIWRVETFESTAYTAQCGNGDGFTASMTIPVPGRTVAVDPGVIPLGSWIYVQGLGWRMAEDTGAAIRGRSIDLYMGAGSAARNDALRWGRKQVLVAYKTAPVMTR
jgi:3D (Asp-Asp-Asp) domain-containing protein